MQEDKKWIELQVFGSRYIIEFEINSGRKRWCKRKFNDERKEFEWTYGEPPRGDE